MCCVDNGHDQRECIIEIVKFKQITRMSIILVYEKRLRMVP